MDRFVVNDTVTLTNTFKVSGTATDPTTIALAVTSPSGTTTTYTYAGATITKSSTGVYTKNITADAAGIWRYTWTGTGTAADVQDSSFTVSTVADATAYTTIEELRDELGNYTSTDTSDDAKAQRAIDAAARAIDDHCGQRFWQDSSVVDRQFYADGVACCFVDADQCAGISTTTGLVVKIDQDGDGTFETTLTINTDFILLPRNAAAEVPVRPYTEVRLVDNYGFPWLSNGRPGVQVSAKFGWPAVPDQVNKACLIVAADLFKSKDAPFGVVGSSEFGQLRVTPGVARMAQMLLRNLQKAKAG